MSRSEQHIQNGGESSQRRLVSSSPIVHPCPTLQPPDYERFCCFTGKSHHRYRLCVNSRNSIETYICKLGYFVSTPQPSYDSFATTNAQMAATTDVEVVDAVTKVQDVVVDATTEVLTSPVDTQDAKNKRRVTSPVWSHFVKRKLDGPDKAECNYCGKS
ncbi:hypothetical protein LXL04_016419 [Taraxacum kok-saghyz]